MKQKNQGRHFWQGEWIDLATLKMRVQTLNACIEDALQVKFDLEEFYRACGTFSARLKTDKALRQQLTNAVVEHQEANFSDAQIMIDEVANFLQENSLRKKMQREFASDNPFRFRRMDLRENIFEAWSPIGYMVQILASNAPTLAVLSAFEGLLTGNLNFIKLSSQASPFTGLLFENFFKDHWHFSWQKLLIIANISSKEQTLLKDILHEADAVVAWGGEEALAQIRQLTPPRARLIEWGHRISFAYISKSALQDPGLTEKIARDVFLYDQQACSSPQCLYIEDASFAELQNFSAKLSQAFRAQASNATCTPAQDVEAAEISRVSVLTKLESALEENLTSVIEDPQGDWRIFVDMRPGLRASPLYRSLWIKPIQRQQVVPVLRPLAQYLQTVGLACAQNELLEITEQLLKAGANRIRSLGDMLDSYPGEPHDGVPALTRYMKKVSLTHGPLLNTFSNLSDLQKTQLRFREWPAQTMDKVEFQRQSELHQKVASAECELFFKSGGSSGSAKTSIFSYDDYHRQMQFAADGLLAAGLDPARDKCMNLFFGGGLYGGFISFFSILEKLKAVQYPMAAHQDFQFVGDIIVEHQVNVLLGMPSYLLQLFEFNSEKFKKHQVIQKIYFGGEHMPETQKQRLRAEFSVQQILSATYGSVDMGPLGYQCVHCPSGIFHLHQELHHLEILQTESLKPAAASEVGRLVFSTHGRQGQHLLRYDIGDLGKWVPEPCACGRQSPRFALLGRQGDVFRVAGCFLNYNKLGEILQRRFSYAHELQICLQKHAALDHLILRLDAKANLDPDIVRKSILQDYADLHEVAVIEQSLQFSVRCEDSSHFSKTPGSGKLRHIIDERE